MSTPVSPTLSTTSLGGLNSAKHSSRTKLTREEQMQLQYQLSDPNLHSSNNAKVYFTDFLRTLQDFQMRQHESYLKGFTRLFRRVDTDSDGILNEEQFISLMDKELSPFFTVTRDDLNYFLQVLDPFNSQKITFSECVQLFSAHMVPSEPNNDYLDGTPLKDGHLPDHENGEEASEENSSQLVPVIERVNQTLKHSFI